MRRYPAALFRLWPILLGVLAAALGGITVATPDWSDSSVTITTRAAAYIAATTDVAVFAYHYDDGLATPAVAMFSAALTCGVAVGPALADVSGANSSSFAAPLATDDASAGSSFSDRQLQSQMAQHGDSMGFSGSPESAADRLDYMSHLVDHIDAPGTTAIEGIYRGAAATHLH